MTTDLPDIDKRAQAIRSLEGVGFLPWDKLTESTRNLYRGMTRTAPTDPVEVAKDPKVAAAVLRRQADEWSVTTHERRTLAAALRAEADVLDPPEPVDPPMVGGQVREGYTGRLFRRLPNGRWICITAVHQDLLDDAMRGCRVVPAAEVRARLGLGVDQ